MPSKKTNTWIKFLQSYTKKQQKTNKNYTYKNAIGDKNAKKMYKEMKGGFFEGETVTDQEGKMQVDTGTEPVAEPVADKETVGGRKSCRKKRKMSKKSKRRRRTSKK